MEKSGVLKQLKEFYTAHREDIIIQCRMTSVLLLIVIAYELGSYERSVLLGQCVSLMNSGCHVANGVINCSGVHGIAPGINISALLK